MRSTLRAIWLLVPDPFFKRSNMMRQRNDQNILDFDFE